MYSAAGVTMIALALIWRVWISVGVLVLLGVIVGYSNIQMLAFLQRQTEPDKMGRVMCLIMLCTHGLLPLSYIAAGAVSKIDAPIPTPLWLGILKTSACHPLKLSFQRSAGVRLDA